MLGACLSEGATLKHVDAILVFRSPRGFWNQNALNAATSDNFEKSYHRPQFCMSALNIHPKDEAWLSCPRQHERLLKTKCAQFCSFHEMQLHLIKVLFQLIIPFKGCRVKELRASEKGFAINPKVGTWIKQSPIIPQKGWRNAFDGTWVVALTEDVVVACHCN